MRPMGSFGGFLLAVSAGATLIVTGLAAIGLAAAAGSGIAFSRRPLATLSARPVSIFRRCATIRERISGVCTLLNSKVSAFAMCVCSGAVWLM